jgi:uncharacterized membrane protein YcaP (DUF421 family)
MPLILDGEIQENTLKHIHKDISWLDDELGKKNLTFKDVFYAFYKNKKIFIIKKAK